jgi:hypothetical protein
METKKVIYLQFLVKFFLTKKRQFCSLVTNKKLFTNGTSRANVRNIIEGCCGGTPRTG